MLFNLHGSVHLGFPHHLGDIGELFWFDDINEAFKVSNFVGASGTTRRPDCTSYLPMGTITGLDKLSRVQRRSMSHFYSAFARDAMMADVFFVIGSGLGDLQINTWLREARSRSPIPTIVFIDRWPDGYAETTYRQLTRKELGMVHDLGIPGAAIGASRHGWTVTACRRAVVSADGFQAFLAQPDELADALGEIGAA